MWRPVRRLIQSPVAGATRRGEFVSTWDNRVSKMGQENPVDGTITHRSNLINMRNIFTANILLNVSPRGIAHAKGCLRKSLDELHQRQSIEMKLHYRRIFQPNGPQL